MISNVCNLQLPFKERIEKSDEDVLIGGVAKKTLEAEVGQEVDKLGRYPVFNLFIAHRIMLILGKDKLSIQEKQKNCTKNLRKMISRRFR